MEHRTQEQLGTALAAMCLEDNASAREHLQVLAWALDLHQERDARYRRGWMARGWLGNVADVLRKTARVRTMFWDNSETFDPKDEPDDVLDLINYCVFTLRNAYAGNRTGADH